MSVDNSRKLASHIQPVSGYHPEIVIQRKNDSSQFCGALQNFSIGLTGRAIFGSGQDVDCLFAEPRRDGQRNMLVHVDRHTHD